MSDPIRDALIELVDAVNEQFFGNANNAIALSSRVITANSQAIRQLRRQAAMAAQSPADAPPPAPACDEEQNVNVELAQWLEQHRQPAPPPAPMAWPELPDCPEEWRTGDRVNTVFARGLRCGYGYARQKLAAMNPNHQQENHQ